MEIKKIVILVLLIVMSSVVVRSQDTLTTLPQFISNWIGKPYRYGGTNENGIDCSAFVQRLYKDVYSITIPRTCRRQLLVATEVSKDSLRVGDVLYFNSRVSPSGNHCGVYIGNDEFIHAANFREGVKISCVDDPMYERLFKAAGRFQ